MSLFVAPFTSCCERVSSHIVDAYHYTQEHVRRSAHVVYEVSLKVITVLSQLLKDTDPLSSIVRLNLHIVHLIDRFGLHVASLSRLTDSLSRVGAFLSAKSAFHGIDDLLSGLHSSPAPSTRSFDLWKLVSKISYLVGDVVGCCKWLKDMGLMRGAWLDSFVSFSLSFSSSFSKSRTVSLVVNEGFIQLVSVIVGSFASMKSTLQTNAFRDSSAVDRKVYSLDSVSGICRMIASTIRNVALSVFSYVKNAPVQFFFFVGDGARIASCVLSQIPSAPCEIGGLIAGCISEVSCLTGEIVSRLIAREVSV